MEHTLQNLEVIRLTRKERLTDRYCDTQVIPLEFKGKQLILITFVEIMSQWNPAREIGATLPQMFARYFTRSTNQSILTRFEDSLKNINKTLELASQKVDSPIKSIIAIHVDGEVYFSTAGIAKIILVRNGKASTVSSNPKDADQVEFATVTSGELSNEDVICYGNEEFLIMAKDVCNAETDLEKAVRTFANTNGSVQSGCIVHTSVSPNGALHTINIDGGNLPINLPQLDVSRLKEFASNAFQRSSGFAKSAINRLQVSAQSRRTQPPQGEPTSMPDSYDPMLDKPGFQFKIPNFTKLKLPKFSPVILAILLIFVAASGYAISRVIKVRNQKAAPVVATVPTLLSDAQAATSSTLPATLAKDLTQERYNFLSTDQATQLDALAAKANITIVKPAAPLFSLPTTIAFVAITPKNDIVYAIDQTGQLYSWEGKVLAKSTQISTVSNPISMTALAKNKVVITDAQGNLFLFDGSDKQPVKLAQPAGWATGTRLLQNYNGNLYVLTVTDGTVHKIPGFGTDLTSDSVLVKVAADTTDLPVSFLINVDINILTLKTGLIDYPKSGKPKTTVVPGNLTATSTASFGVDNIAISNGPLINFYSLQGQYQSSKAVVLSDKISQIVSYGSNGQLITVGSSVYLIP